MTACHFVWVSIAGVDTGAVALPGRDSDAPCVGTPPHGYSRLLPITIFLTHIPHMYAGTMHHHNAPPSFKTSQAPRTSPGAPPFLPSPLCVRPFCNVMYWCLHCREEEEPESLGLPVVSLSLSLSGYMQHRTWTCQCMSKLNHLNSSM